MAVSEKVVLDTDRRSSTSSAEITNRNKTNDSIQNADPDISNVDVEAARRKVDLHLIPLMFTIFGLQWLDKVAINYAAVMGFNEDLHLRGDNFSDITSATAVAYLIAEIPNGYFLHKFPVGKWLAGNVVIWGIVTCSFAGTTNFATLLTTRIFLGIFESCTVPAMMLICSQWYTRSEAASRFQFWSLGRPMAQILGGLLSFAFQKVDHAALSGWRIMFLALGAVTISSGVVAAFILPNSPMEASWVGEKEKAALSLHVNENKTGGEGKPRFEMAQLRELASDPQIWLMTLITCLITMSSGVISGYSSTLIKQFGYTSKEAALLNIPSGLVTLAFALLVAFGITYTSNRWAWLLACCIPAMIGGALMSYAPKDNKPALLAGIYLVNAISPPVIIIFQWTMANITGHTKRSVASVVVSSGFAAGAVIGPQTFRKEDAPNYHNAKIILLASQAAAAGLTVVLMVYYKLENKRRDRRQGESVGAAGVLDPAEGRLGNNSTDRKNLDFRYVY